MVPQSKYKRYKLNEVTQLIILSNMHQLENYYSNLFIDYVIINK